MTLWQALLYFLREAAVSLVRSWKVSFLAVFTIAVSLYVGGGVMLVGSNLAELARQWRREARVVVYLVPESDAEARQSLLAEARSLPWATDVRSVDAGEAAERFQETFPSLADLVEGDQATQLPASIEVALAGDADPDSVTRWAESMRGRPGVDMVDDDRDWLGQLDTLTALLRGAGVTLGAVLLGAAIFTIASVIRLTAFLYHEEIAVMRLVGATEFYIRGPFYAEGFLQGLLGGLVAVGGLVATWGVVLRPGGAGAAGLGLVGQVLGAGGVGWREGVALVGLGGVAGLVGAVVSLRREQLDQVAEVGEPTGG